MEANEIKTLIKIISYLNEVKYIWGLYFYNFFKAFLTILPYNKSSSIFLYTQLPLSSPYFIYVHLYFSIIFCISFVHFKINEIKKCLSYKQSFRFIYLIIISSLSLYYFNKSFYAILEIFVS